MNKLDFPLKIFVYGTLKRGGSNHDVMIRAGGTFLCEAKTVEWLRTDRNPPTPCDGHAPDGYQVEGEIYEIPDARARTIDTSSNGSFYQRRLDDFTELDSPKEHTAWVYYMVRELDGEPRKFFRSGND